MRFEIYNRYSRGERIVRKRSKDSKQGVMVEEKKQSKSIKTHTPATTTTRGRIADSGDEPPASRKADRCKIVENGHLFAVGAAEEAVARRSTVGSSR